MPQPLRKLREYAREHDLDAKLRQAAPTLGVLAVLFLVVVAIEVVWKVPHWEVQRSLHNGVLSDDQIKQLNLEDAFRKTLTQIVLSVFGLFILWFTWRRARAGDTTVRIMEQGHITDRFTKAIEQLGKLDGDRPNIEVRLGAIYALERIAIDSPRDHWTIMEVLTAYVRQNAPLDPERPYTKGEKPRTDIQAILTILGRRKTGPNRERPGQPLDLSASRLCGASLDSRIDSQVASLAYANLNHANLEGASLNGANLQGAILANANLQGALLADANLQDAILANTNLEASEANRRVASLAYANLNNANLFAAHLNGAYLQGAHLNNTHLQGASLNYANLQGASQNNANLLGASLLGLKGWNPEQIKSAKNWETARYSLGLREALGLPLKKTVESEASPDPDSDEPTKNDYLHP